MKQRIQGIIIGFLACALMTTTVFAANRVTRELTYGIGVILNGQPVQFNEDSRPFVIDGRTFLPLRALAELLGIPVDFDPVANNAILGRAEVMRGTPVSELFFDGTTTGSNLHSSSDVTLQDNVVIGGRNYNGVITFAANSWTDGTAYQNAMFNLNRQYKWFDVSIGRVDGTAPIDAVVNIYADDNLVETFEQSANSLTKELRLFVEGVRLIRVEVIRSYRNPVTSTYALFGFAE